MKSTASPICTPYPNVCTKTKQIQSFIFFKETVAIFTSVPTFWDNAPLSEQNGNFMDSPFLIFYHKKIKIQVKNEVVKNIRAKTLSCSYKGNHSKLLWKVEKRKEVWKLFLKRIMFYYKTC